MGVGVPVTPVTSTPAALEAIELSAALTVVSRLAAGPLGAARVAARRPSADLERARDELATCHELAEWLRGNGSFRPAAVDDVEPLFERLALAGGVLDGVELASVARILVALRATDEELARAEEHVPRLQPFRVELPPTSVDRALAKAIDPDGYVRDEASAALGKIRRRLRDGRETLVGRLEAMLAGLGDGGGGGVTVRGGRYVIPVRRELRGRVRGIVHDESASGATVFVEPSDTVEQGNALRELEGSEAREVQRVLRELTDRLRDLAPLLRSAWEAAVRADDLAARAHYAVLVDGHLPELVAPGQALAIRGGRHPLLLEREQAGGPAVIPFDLDLSDTERTVLLSGPNTGGKTVLMKAVGLMAAMAQAGVVPPVGPRTRLPVFQAFFADIGDRQSIAESMSTFSAHVAVLRDVLEGADAGALVLLDEVGAGTDPAEGGALAAAALQALTDRGALTLATTHLGALKRLADADARIVNASLQFDAEALTPTYRLVKGVPGRSYGLAIARRLGVPADVLAHAEEAVPSGERELDRALADLEERRTTLERALAEVEGREVRVARDASAMEERERMLGERERAVRASEREAKHAARAATRQYLLEARRAVEEALAMARGAADDTTARAARRLVEDAARRAAPEGRPAKSRSTRSPDSSVTEAGDRVRTPVGTVGTVRELRPDGRAVVELGGVRLVVDAEGLEPVDQADTPTPTPPAYGMSDHAPAAATVDLRGLRADDAEDALLRAIDDGVRDALGELTVIHGKGTGALRECVHRLAAADRRVTDYQLAPPARGGAGVTLLRLAT